MSEDKAHADLKAEKVIEMWKSRQESELKRLQKEHDELLDCLEDTASLIYRLVYDTDNEAISDGLWWLEGYAEAKKRGEKNEEP